MIRVLIFALIVLSACNDNHCRGSASHIGTFGVNNLTCSTGATMTVQRVGNETFAVCTCADRDGGGR